MFQTGEVGSFQSSPIVYSGKMYFTTARNTYAIDGTTCHLIWATDAPDTGTAALPTNRGVALYKGLVFRGTLDRHLIALDAENGKLIWDKQVCDGSKDGGFISAAPIVFDGKLFIGEAGGDTGKEGRIHAFEAMTGRHLWAFDTVPTGRQPGADTWKNDPTPAGGATWSTITIDPARRELYVPIGNPYPDTDGSIRQGINRYQLDHCIERRHRATSMVRPDLMPVTS
jgi:alcohol dehydrogenase (cytochrome c)